MYVLSWSQSQCFSYMYSWYMSHKRQVWKAKIVKHTKEISHGPTIAQKYIRNLAQVPHQRVTSSGLENEVPGSREEILEFQDVTDYGRYNDCTIKFQSVFCKQTSTCITVQFFAEHLPASATICEWFIYIYIYTSSYVVSPFQCCMCGDN